MSLWDTKSLKFKDDKAHEDTVLDVYFIYQIENFKAVQYIVTVSEDNSFKIWNLEICSLQYMIKDIHKDKIVQSCLAQKNKLDHPVLITSGYKKDLCLKFWDLSKRKLIHVIRNPHDDVVKKIEAFKRDDSRIGTPFLITLSYDATLKIWNLNTYSKLKTIKLNMIYENYIFFTEDTNRENVLQEKIALLSFKEPEIHVFNMLSFKKSFEINNFYLSQKYDRSISLKLIKIEKINYLLIAHIHGGVLYNIEGRYPVYEFKNAKLMFSPQIEWIRLSNRILIFYSKDKMLYEFEFEIKSNLLYYSSSKEFVGDKCITAIKIEKNEFKNTKELDFIKCIFKFSYNTMEYLTLGS